MNALISPRAVCAVRLDALPIVPGRVLAPMIEHGMSAAYGATHQVFPDSAKGFAWHHLIFDIFCLVRAPKLAVESYAPGARERLDQGMHVHVSASRTRPRTSYEMRSFGALMVILEVAFSPDAPGWQGAARKAGRTAKVRAVNRSSSVNSTPLGLRVQYQGGGLGA